MADTVDILKADPLALAMTRLHVQEDGTRIVESLQDIEPILEHAKGLYNQYDERSRWRGDGALNHVAVIPLNTYFEMQRLGIIDDQNDCDQIALMAWLNDRDNEKLRTRPGRIGPNSNV